MHRDDLHEIPPADEPDPFWVLMIVAALSACIGIGLFWMAVFGWI